MPKVIKVIESQITKGEGTAEDCYRLVIQYHDLKGKFLAEFDAWAPTKSSFDLLKIIDLNNQEINALKEQLRCLLNKTEK